MKTSTKIIVGIFLLAVLWAIVLGPEVVNACKKEFYVYLPTIFR